MTPFAFGVVSTGEPDRHAWLELARTAEGLGYDALYVTDHVHQPLAPFPALAAAAAVTERLRLGPRVLNLAIRNVTLIAHELAALDVLSGGRAELGIGAGWLRDDALATGGRLAPAGSRVQRLIDAFGALDALLRGEPVDGGEPFRTVQRPRPPITIGGAGPRLLTFAAEHADLVSITGASPTGDGLDEADLSPERLDEKVAWIRRAAGARAAGLPLNHVVWECMVTPRPMQLLDAYAAAMGVPAARVRELPALLIGSVEQVAEILLARHERWGLTSVAIPAQALEQFAPVIARLA
jgi:probable F420-dependent oxidoreductase